MAYNNKNYLLKVKHVAEVTKMHYEPGRQDRCHVWVWRKYIRDTFHVDYPTYMRWLRDDPDYSAYMKQIREQRASERKMLQEDRTRIRRPGTRGRRKPGKTDAHA